MSNLKTNLEQILLEKQTKIIPENIKKDIEIFNITGTYEGSSSFDNMAKIFETQEEMQADTNASEGDLAVVYREEIQNMTVDTQTQYITFPETVTLPTAFSGSAYCTLRAIDSSSGYFSGDIQLSQSSFSFHGFGDSGTIGVQYESEDGITYTRITSITNPVDLGTTIQVDLSGGWDDNIGYFMQVGGNVFEGLFEYKEDESKSFIVLSNEQKIEILPAVFTTNTKHILYNAVYDKSNRLTSCTLLEGNAGTTGLYFDGTNVVSGYATGYVGIYDVTCDWTKGTVIRTHRNNPAKGTVLFDSTNSLYCNFDAIYSDSTITTIAKEAKIVLHPLLYQIADTQLNAIADDVYKKVFYGQNGVETGTLTQNISNSFADVNAEVYYKIQQAYDNMEPRILTDDDKEIDENIYLIPTKLDGTPLLNTSNVTNMFHMFYNCTNLTTIPLLDTSNVTNMRGLFSYCKNLTTIPLLDISNVINTSNMFEGCSNLTTIPLLDTSSVVNMDSMFDGCKNLTTIPLLDTSNVTSMQWTFRNCSKLTTIPLLETSQATTLYNTFVSCTNLVSIPQLNTSKVTDMGHMFDGCTNLVSISQLDTSKVTGMINTFKGCTSLVDIPQLDTSSLELPSDTFDGCINLSDESLNNILLMWANATKVRSNFKTLRYTGLSEEQVQKCMTLSNWSACESAGWTTGY